MKLKSPRSNKRSRSGFTLIELLVAMGLFALISLAGFTLLSGIIRTRDRLDGRLDQLAQLQRAMYLMALDFEAMTRGPIQVDGGSVAFIRCAPDIAGGTLAVRYAVIDDGLHRLTGTGSDQVIVSNVTRVEWRFMERDGWVDRPTSQPPPLATDDNRERPRAVEATLMIAGERGGLSGPLRRVIELPRQP